MTGGMVKGFNPDQWLESVWRGLKHYVDNGFSDAYDIRLGFPAPSEQAEFIKRQKTVVHFEIDDIENPIFGFGDNIVQEVYDDTPGSELVTEIEAECHKINFDIGVWATAISGGTTSRLRVLQYLDKLFNGAQAFKDAKEQVGVEIIEYGGGHFVTEDVADGRFYRVVGITLIVRVYSRRVLVPKPTIEEVEQAPTMKIDTILVT